MHVLEGWFLNGRAPLGKFCITNSGIKKRYYLCGGTSTHSNDKPHHSLDYIFQQAYLILDAKDVNRVSAYTGGAEN
jgi:hypothetical protein